MQLWSSYAKRAWVQRCLARLLNTYGGVSVPCTYCSYVGVSGWLWREVATEIELGDGERLMAVPRGKGQVHLPPVYDLRNMSRDSALRAQLQCTAKQCKSYPPGQSPKKLASLLQTGSSFHVSAKDPAEKWDSLEKAFVSPSPSSSTNHPDQEVQRWVGLDRSVDELLDVYPEYPHLTAGETEAEIRDGRKGQYVSMDALQRRHKMEAKMYV